MSKLIPTEEQFRKDISSIFIDENIDYSWALERLKFHLDDTIPGNEQALTYQDILAKYRSHIENWNLRNAEKERKGFLDKDQQRKRKNIIQFLESRLYLLEWTYHETNPLRDNYLFGTIIPMDEILSQLKEFKQSCTKNHNGGK